jgi:hypothetical protein
MKTFINKYTLIAIASLSLISCSNNDSNQTIASAQSFSNLQTIALNSVTQNFTMNAEDGLATFTSQNGVIIKINGNGLSKNGNSVVGLVTIKYREIFDAGKMLTTDKTTMGLNSDGKMALLISGGEFYINATQGGDPLTISSTIQLIIPTSLTGGTNASMSLWTGLNPTTTSNMLGWIGTSSGSAGTIGVSITPGPVYNSTSYNATIPGFGWFNVDCFYNDARPRTQIFATVPSGYNGMNAAIYLHYDGQKNSLMKFDTYLTESHRFSEHYGQIPIGLEAHVIFVTEDNGNWRYAIKPVTVKSGDVYNFTLTETVLGNQAQLESAINALP